MLRIRTPCRHEDSLSAWFFLVRIGHRSDIPRQEYLCSESLLRLGQ